MRAEGRQEGPKEDLKVKEWKEACSFICDSSYASLKCYFMSLSNNAGQFMRSVDRGCDQTFVKFETL